MVPPSGAADWRFSATLAVSRSGRPIPASRCRAGGTVDPVLPDPDTSYRAMQSRDPCFDGWFYVGVTTTGIYCRPGCPARTPQREHVRFFATAAAAQSAGFGARLRCRPDAVPGSPQWNLRADAAGRAMRLIADGVVDREGVEGLPGARLQSAPPAPGAAR